MGTNHPLKPSTPVVILSGGAEIVTISILEEFAQKNIPVVLISLGMESLARDTPGVIAYQKIKWPPQNHQSLQQLENFLKKIDGRQTQPWPIFATEDGGCRFLFENEQSLSHYVKIFGSKRLSMKGLDKAELFACLQENDCHDLIPETMSLSYPDEIKTIYNEWGSTFILKPALKPFTLPSGLGKHGAKILSLDPQESIEQFINRCHKYWSISNKWIAQKKMMIPKEGEGLWWGIRFNDGTISGLTAMEHWNYPRWGGTGCWVATTDIPELHAKAERILSAIDFHGVAEIPFLKDETGSWKMLELNPRPWLQIALPREAGVPLLHWLYSEHLTKQKPDHVSTKTSIPKRTWVNPERMFLAAVSGEYGSRLHALRKFLIVAKMADYQTIYSTTHPKIKFRWIMLLIQKLFRKC